MGCQENNSSRDGIHKKNSRIHLGQITKQMHNCKRFKNSTNFEQVTGIQEKLDTACKQNASK